MCEDWEYFPEDDYDYEDDGLDKDDFWDEFPEEGDWEDEEEAMFKDGG